MSKPYNHGENDFRNSEYSVGTLVKINSTKKLLANNVKWLKDTAKVYANRKAMIVDESADSYLLYFPDKDEIPQFRWKLEEFEPIDDLLILHRPEKVNKRARENYQNLIKGEKI